MNKKIFIVVPHSYCKSSTKENRLCDMRSEDVAKLLKEKLKNKSNTITYFKLNESVPRNNVDLNRIKARSSKYAEAKKWRCELSGDVIKELDENDTQEIWVLEIHSFPDKSFGDDTKMVILNNQLSRKDGEGLLYYFAKKNTEFNGYIRYIMGSLDNDIMTELKSIDFVTKKRINVLFLEFNENENVLTNEQLNNICNTIINYIYSKKNISKCIIL